MKAAILASALCLSLGTTALAAKNDAEEKNITEMATKFVAAWSKDDAKAMAGFFAEDATVINPVGRRANGRAEIEKLMADEHTSNLKATKATMTPETFRFVKPDLAFVDFAMEIAGMKSPDGKDMPVMRLHLATLVAKKAKRWWWLDARPYAFITPPPEVATNKN